MRLARRKQMRILVVEDEFKTADYLRKGLSESGYLVEVALNGLDGQHLIQESEFDLIILDVMAAAADRAAQGADAGAVPHRARCGGGPGQGP